ncbi:S46 family peptidase [Bacteroidota bacterium]
MKKIVTIILIILFSTSVKLKADEGMWLPLLLKNEKFKEMRHLGLKLSSEEIYSINKACIKDAVVGLMNEGSNLRSFGTASFISSEGLLITNYHVVISFVERFSSPENDFIKYGYWAKEKGEESLCRGLQMKQLIRMEDVTERMLQGTKGMNHEEKTLQIDKNGREIAKEVTKGNNLEVRMSAMFGGNQFIMSVYKVFKDIRLVAAPPISIGKFGGNSDNYSWPRHTGDFALLRVYANKENEPAPYSKSNTPYKPTYYLPVSLKGIKEGDFIFIAGFPGSTREYVPSFALERIIYGENAHKVAIRKEKMDIIKNAIEANPDLKFRYTTRLSSIGNSYLRWKGEISGVTKMNLVELKKEDEQKFRKWVQSDTGRIKLYGSVLDSMEILYKEVAEYNLADAYFNEAGINGSEIVPFIGKFEKLVAIYSSKRFDQKSADSEVKRLKGLTDQFFENWDIEIDRKIFRNLMKRYYETMPDKFKSKAMVQYINEYNGDLEKLSSDIYYSSIFSSKEKLMQFLNDEQRDIVKSIKSDPLYKISIGYYMINVERIMTQRAKLQAKLLELNNLYMMGVLEMNRGIINYPDANYTLRISYGTVKGAAVEEGVFYSPFTTLEGVNYKYLINKEDPDFYMPKKLRELYVQNDYSEFASRSGKLNVNFLTNAHTTSGNSGSPVLNSKGELIGVNFDRIWQGLSSDYRYDPNLSRSIAVDIRYILFILKKYSGSDYVLKELEIR